MPSSAPREKRWNANPTDRYNRVVPRLLLLFPFTAVIALAQQQPEIPSPYQIAEAFSSSRTPNFAALMTRLGLPTQLDETSEFRDLECDKWTCRVELTGAGPIAVRISSKLAFRIVWMEEQPRSRTWAVRGYLDGHSKYGVTVRFVSKYHPVESTGTSVSPYWSIVQNLYEPRNGRLISVLRLPAYGQESNGPGQPHRKWNVTIVDTLARSKDKDQLIAYIRLVVTTHDTDPPVFADERRIARFVRPAGAPAFRLDPKQSDISQRDLDGLFHATEDPPDHTLFLNFTRASLLQIARGPAPVKRRWLRAYLAQSPPSPIKSQLLRALLPSK